MFWIRGLVKSQDAGDDAADGRSHRRAGRVAEAVEQREAGTWAGPPHKQFKKCIGTYLHADKKPRPKIFWLGRDADQAEHLARCLQLGWGFRHFFGDGHWTPELERLAREAYADEQSFAEFAVANLRQQVTRMVKAGIAVPRDATLARVLPPPDAGPPPTAAAGVPDAPGREQGNTLGRALEQYVEVIRSKPGSESYRRRIVESVNGIKHYAADLVATAELAGDRRALAKYVADTKATCSGGGTCRSRRSTDCGSSG
jgi:hypothetical protein